jgi:hypothetical protein
MQRRICSNEDIKLYADLEIGSLYWNTLGISLYRYKLCILSKNVVSEGIAFPRVLRNPHGDCGVGGLESN